MEHHNNAQYSIQRLAKQLGLRLNHSDKVFSIIQTQNRSVPIIVRDMIILDVYLEDTNAQCDLIGSIASSELAQQDIPNKVKSLFHLSNEESFTRITHKTVDYVLRIHNMHRRYKKQNA